MSLTSPKMATSSNSFIPDFSNSTNNSSSVNSKPIGGKLSKFGAVKVVKSVNFDEIEAKARIEREEADRRGLSGKSTNVPASMPHNSPPASTVSSASNHSINNNNNNHGTKASSPTSTTSNNTANVISKEQQEAMDRLGMGMRKMNIGQSVSSSNSATAASAKIKQQSISSEQFSSSSARTSNEDSYVNDRLREMDTTKGISSDAFFGRTNSGPVEESDDYYKSTNSLGSSSSSKNYANLSNSAKDFASKIAERASTIDVKGMKKSISSAGSRLSAYLQDLQNK
jgi:ADP-ribosylation factor GTPase-activating protein 2/3